MYAICNKVGEHFIICKIYDRYAHVCSYSNIGGKVKIIKTRELIRSL
jgi:hypothetical protein